MRKLNINNGRKVKALTSRYCLLQVYCLTYGNRPNHRNKTVRKSLNGSGIHEEPEVLRQVRESFLSAQSPH